MPKQAAHVYLVAPAGSVWADRFSSAAEGRCAVSRLRPEDLEKQTLSQPVSSGVVVYYEPSLEVGGAEWFGRLRVCVRYMDLPLIAVTPRPSFAARAQLLAAGASAVCNAEEPPERVIEEVENRSNVEPVMKNVREQLLDPFIDATLAALREMADARVSVHSVYRKQGYRIFGDHSALVSLKAESEGTLVMSFPKETSRELGRRLLAPLGVEVTEELVQSCLAEITNIVVGQAKGRLADTCYRFSMSVPTVVSGSNHEIRYKPGLPCLVALFTSDMGDFALQLCMAF